MFVLKDIGPQFDAGILGGEPPVHAHRITIAALLPRFYLATQGLPVRYATLQALSSQHSDLYLRHIQPTPVFGCVVYLQTLSYTPRLRRLERLVERGQPVRVESLPCT